MSARLGFYTRIDSDDGATSSYRDAVDQFEHAERLGYSTGWIGQEHFGATTGGTGSPLVLLGHIAAGTTRIGLGVASVDLPTENPIRVAEDAGILDLLSGGRLELGLGAIGDRATYHAFGQQTENRAESFAVRLDLLVDALTDRPIGLPENRVRPFVPRLASALWLATASEAGGQRAGTPGHGLILPRSQPRPSDWAEASLGSAQLPIVDAYRRALAPGTPPRIAVSRTLFIGASRSEGEAAAERGFERFAERRLADGQPWQWASTSDLARRFDAIVGDPADIAAVLNRDPVVRAATDLIFHIHLVNPPQDEFLGSLDLIATELAPLIDASLLTAA